MLDIHNHDIHGGHFIGSGSMLISVISAGYEYHYRYRIKIKLICRIKKRLGSIIGLDIHNARVSTSGKMIIIKNTFMIA